ncbi:hypothetical protein [Phascolarctobacterium sp.]|uniref:hypothetical protein n=1 Tax=Phascolarctobacterium sp. TaxID=2049039 RepID=UPI00386AF6D9
MNIKGTASTDGGAGLLINTGTNEANVSGAFYKSTDKTYSYRAGTTNQGGCNLGFDASRNWTGQTSSVGTNVAHNNLPPYTACYLFKRTT